MMQVAEARGKDNAGGGGSRGWEMLGRLEDKWGEVIRTQLTSLIDEEMPKCIWELLFALLPKDTDTEWDHLSQESPPR